ncbi:hypothetical protein [Deinococcus radiodurans]|jgi:hypothetical protein|uniref:Uncharacterized protein n=1 Tax=Deinococcus radiodurans (strain ATCC 13939 / DSM 20539 / JCM 16871 / CCUG 27074 / LMG 4051 / NBRC 15346 / NCIMB 9279 / VKM B-1422 / R1) TaxID=243230 RepID=Q9RS91_DEIRA|nr:hypothetical protein [Deinococcus radiodurans]AAF11790.1 hypothetical protein DR_2236 [Deinococcus radiodurans R1 = ATCC 13939 = DSM 20539]ANC70705.1 hypothetical protein A2G07_02395 [Deinococcus radiodurans R1 = ATCC 13939 = DSM 20539]QEM71621.1 hypothetical protein DXG80_07500 [Deinococcus radiodurans]QIP27926.1 hypothetical protein HAV23_00860 [Deinococcus radiodurans]QIP31192.1 hypothetical protein HAV35_02650 [Deinococcus radiodurans]
MTAPTRSEALQLLLDDHLPAYLRLPSDFLVWTGAEERMSPDLCAERETCGRGQSEVQAAPVPPTR